VSWAARAATAASGTVPGEQAPGPSGPSVSPGPLGSPGSAQRKVRSVSGAVSVIGAAVIWSALLGPVIALLTHLSWHALTSSLTAPGALDPLVVSLESGAVTLGVLFVICTPLAWLMSRGRLPFPRVW
jgi:ABC-type sulfate transport system permease component